MMNIHELCARLEKLKNLIDELAGAQSFRLRFISAMSSSLLVNVVRPCQILIDNTMKNMQENADHAAPLSAAEISDVTGMLNRIDAYLVNTHAPQVINEIISLRSDLTAYRDCELPIIDMLTHTHARAII
ncbi:hypothetical protein AQUSIP_08580 [Aquicella siphonis]|uniref:Uncharacterized protein n=1 Tax=Aquicella siphonis TaxID=254247 RepID=A0A5E4PGC5_9COXI|nr:hypothetical protein [Aquicella siphonis]VVC75568.1 hypothetical protein AQUSIP_08580 [Aquicella siphonis]